MWHKLIPGAWLCRRPAAEVAKLLRLAGFQSGHARPHPGLLPQEKGSDRLPLENSCAGDGTGVVEQSGNDQRLFPAFDGPVNWRLQYWKAPCVILTGKADTNALHQFINDHPVTECIWSGTNANGGNNIETGWPDPKDYPTTYWKSMWFQTEAVVGGYKAVIKGWVDFPAADVTIQSWGSD